MNKLLYKVIFNSNIGLMIVVCETAHNNGKSSNDRICKIIVFAIVDVRETVSDAYFTQNGFTKLDGKCGAQCFDGVYIKHGEIYIVEVKPLNANGSITLSSNSKSPNNIGVQMSDNWINSRARELAKNGATPEAKATGRTILTELKKEGGFVNKIVVGVNDQTMVTVNLGKGRKVIE